MHTSTTTALRVLPTDLLLQSLDAGRSFARSLTIYQGFERATAIPRTSLGYWPLTAQ